MSEFTTENPRLGKPRLSSGSKTRGETRWKQGVEDPVLRAFQVVGSAMKVHDHRVGIEQRKGRPPVAVAGLSHGSRIDEIASGTLELQRDRFRLSDGLVFGTESIGGRAVGEESTLQMSVTKKSQRDR